MVFSVWEKWIGIPLAYLVMSERTSGTNVEPDGAVICETSPHPRPWNMTALACAMARIFLVMTLAAISGSLIFNFTTNGNWANLGYVAPHPFETGTTNGLTFYNAAGLKGDLPRAERQERRGREAAEHHAASRDGG